MPSRPQLAAVHRRRSSSDLLALVAALGGNAAVPAIYDTRFGVTAGAALSQWDDARGASGFGPSLSVISGTAPIWDAANKIVQAGGGSIATPASALFDISSAFTLVVVGSITRASGQYAAGISDAAARTRTLGIKNIGGVAGTVAGAWYSGGAEVTKATGVDANASSFFVTFARYGAATGSTRVMTQPNMTTAVTAPTSGSNRLTLFDFAPAGGSVATEGKTQAIIAIAKVTSAAEDNIIRDWAVKYRGAVTV